MRKYIFLLLLLGGFSSQMVMGQFEAFGIKGGLCFGTPISKIIEGATATPGMNGTKGFFGRWKVSDRVSVQAEMLFTLKANTFNTPISGDTIVLQFIPNVGYLPFAADYKGVVKGRFRNRYIEVPLTARLNSGKHWSFLGGVYGAYLLFGDNSGTADIELGQGFDFRNDEPFDQTEFLFPWDYGLVAGAEYHWDNWLIDLRAVVGLRTIYEKDYPQVSNAVWNGYLQGTLGYIFPSKP